MPQWQPMAGLCQKRSRIGLCCVLWGYHCISSIAGMVQLGRNLSWSTKAGWHHMQGAQGLPALANTMYSLAEQPRDEP